jgi:hypothetical protein
MQGSGQVRLVAVKGGRFNSDEFGMIAVDTVSLRGTVQRIAQQYNCIITFDVVGVLEATERVISSAFPLKQPPDEVSMQAVTFDVRIIENQALFREVPHVRADGALVLPLATAGRGEAILMVQIFDDGGTAHGGSNVSALYPFRVRVDSFEKLPSFSIKPLVEASDGVATSLNDFAIVESFKDLPEDAEVFVTFHVRCASNAQGFFVTHPEISLVGVLSFEIARLLSGRAVCSVCLASGTLFSQVQEFTIVVWPRPVVESVQPFFADIISPQVSSLQW